MLSVNLKTKILSKWPILVHSWGGMGSQLFACVVAKRLMHKFPERRIVLVFHSSGVTYRGIELNSKLTSMFDFEFQDDYRPGEDHSKTQNRTSRVDLLRGVFLSVLVKIGILARLNEEYEFESISCLLSQVRGHYARIKLNDQEIDWILKSLELSNIYNFSSSKTFSAMHLRLGDLLTLESKTHINLERLERSKSYLSNTSKLIIYSDSEKEEVMKVIGDRFNDLEVEIFCVDTREVMSNCLRAQVFVGTNSKISLWIAIIRSALGLGHATVLPSDLAKQAVHILSSINPTQEILQY